MSHEHHHHDHGAAPAKPGYPDHPEQDIAAPPSHDHAHGHHDHGGHDAHAGHSAEMFRDKFWLTLILAIPTLVWSQTLQDWFGYTAPRFPGSSYIPAVFGTIVYFYGGWAFLQGAYHELKARLPGMMTLIALAITVAFAYSLAVTLGYPGMDLWWELATLVAIMLLGHWIEIGRA